MFIDFSDNPKMKIRMVQRRRATYSQETLKKALAELKEGVGINTVSRVYEIPRSTLQAKKSNRYPTSKPGPDPVLTKEEEDNIVKWIDYMCGIRRSITRDHLIDSVALYVKKMAKPNLFVDGRPGRHWLEGFFRRNDGVKLKIRNHNAAISKHFMNLENLTEWFETLNSSIRHENLDNIDSARVFNIGEMVAQMNLTSESSKENVTVLLCGNAAGQFAPTMIIFDSEIHGNLTIDSLPGKFICTSKKALMTSELFYEYISKHFYPWLLENKIQTTIILFVDEHVSYFTQVLSEFCCDYSIAVVALPMNTTDFMHPMEIELFPRLRDFSKVNLNIPPSKYEAPKSREYFELALQEVLNRLNVDKILSTSFAECGLYPFASRAIEYKKIFAKGQSKRGRRISNDQEPEDPNSLLQSIELLIDPIKLKAFRAARNTYKWQGNVKDTSLFYLWKKVLTISGQRNKNTFQNNIENVSYIALSNI